jgi:hypothetical protein
VNSGDYSSLEKICTQTGCDDATKELIALLKSRENVLKIRQKTFEKKQFSQKSFVRNFFVGSSILGLSLIGAFKLKQYYA